MIALQCCTHETSFTNVYHAIDVFVYSNNTAKVSTVLQCNCF